MQLISSMRHAIASKTIFSQVAPGSRGQTADASSNEGKAGTHGLRRQAFTRTLLHAFSPTVITVCLARRPARTGFLGNGSGRRDSSPRQPAWEAGTLPLSYSRLRCFSFL